MKNIDYRNKFRLLFIVIFMEISSSSNAQHFIADSAWCNSVVKANPEFSGYVHRNRFHRNGMPKESGYFLKIKAGNGGYFLMPVGKIILSKKSGSPWWMWYFNEQGQPVADTLFYSDGSMSAVRLYDSVGYYFKRAIPNLSYADNYYSKEFRSNNTLKCEGRIVQAAKKPRSKRSGKWIFYDKAGVVRKVKYY